MHALWDKNIYSNFKKRAFIVRNVILVLNSFKLIEKESNQEEAMYHFIISLIDLIYNKCKGDNLSKYVSSIIYLAYEQDIITEEFYTSYALTNMRYMPQKQNMFNNQENEEKFHNDTSDFRNWLMYQNII